MDSQLSRIGTCRLRSPACILLLAAFVLTAAGGALAAGPSPADENRNFDARQGRNQGFNAPTNLTQDQALQSLRDRYPDLLARTDSVFGVTRSLFNPSGFLSDPSPQSAENAALAFVRGHSGALGLTNADLANVELTDEVYSRVSDVTHLYFGQRHQGLGVWGAQLQVHLSAATNQVVSVGNGFVADIESAGRNAVADLSAAEAVAAFATQIGLDFQGDPEVVATFGGPEQLTELSHPEISTEPITAKLMWLPLRHGEARLVWNFNVSTPDGNHTYDVTMGADDAALWTQVDSTASDSYTVYARPLENPLEGGRTVVSNPADGQASPNTWHDSNLMDGNNVHAYHDQDANNLPPGTQPSCGASRDCNFPINLGQDPTAYTNAAVANLFYWTNTIHDIQWKYGFDEAGGNFQENNFGRGGAGSDSLNAEAQDGSGTNNANMSTPSDGGNPRMQMFLWNQTNPRRDGDLDNGIIAHEYGHGISIRQVGGPNTNCLGGQQQPGEGWSDLMALIYTAKSNDQGGDARGVGGYAANSGGIRPQPYSTNTAINTVTYQTIRSGVSIPHGVGWAWASIVWETYWNMVDDHGFGDLADAGTFGNQRAMFYINEGLKFTNCGGNTVDFLDARDGIIQAASVINGGVDVCRLWEGFAKRGLGVDATTTGSNASATNGFNVPAACDNPPPPPPPPPPCDNELHFADFEGGGADGWTQGADTCLTGSFVVGNPDPVTNGGVQTQPNGSASGTGSFFTQPNTGGAGTDDVDGGTCEALSPVVSASGTVTINLDYFHGQRDAGGDDGFSIEVLNDGVVVDTIVNDGGITSNAVWTGASTTISNAGNVQLRVRATDGPASGDLVEGGVDNVQICGDTGTPPPPPPPPTGDCLFTEDFGGGAGGFVFVDDPQDPAYTSGQAAGGAVSVAVGGVDDADITDMLGSWDRGCSLNSSTAVTINVTANLTQAANYEANEVSELRLTLNGNTNVLASFTGDGNGGAAQTTGLQTFTVNTTLPSGSNTISLGCFNNLKTLADEETDCVFDSISVTPAGGGNCTVDDDFEGGAAGWSNDGASTCITGAYVLGTPTLVTDSGVTTQVGGANSGVNAIFTAANSSAGVDDVDGGNCILTSPTFNVSSASTLSIAYFHGQRDAGDDPGGDFFSVDVSTNGGATFTPIVSNGDSTSNAAWSTANASIPAGSNVVVRVQCSDGAATGDLVECGIDDISICN